MVLMTTSVIKSLLAPITTTGTEIATEIGPATTIVRRRRRVVPPLLGRWKDATARRA